MIFKLEYKNKDLDVARLEITTPGLVEKTIEGTEDPFRLIYKLDKSDKSGHFLTSSAEINIYETEEFNIDALKTSNETEIKVDYYINNIKKWTGFVIPDFFSKEIGKRSVVSMVASDRIGTLKGVTLTDLNAFVSLRTLAEQCLSNTGLSLPLNTMVDLEADAVNFFNVDAFSQRLVDNKGRSISCYDILSSILVSSNSIILQRNAEWYIVNKLQHELGQGKLYSDSTTFTNWQDIIHYFSDVNVGARRTIIPVAASTGVYHEHGGGRKYPDNYNFADGLAGWTAKNGFAASIDNKKIDFYLFGAPSFSATETVPPYLLNNNQRILSGNSMDLVPYIESSPIAVKAVEADRVNVNIDISVTAPGGASHLADPAAYPSFVRYAVIATNGPTKLALNRSGAFETYNPNSYETQTLLTHVRNTLDRASFADDIPSAVSGTLIAGNDIANYNITIRIYGSGTYQTVLINQATITFSTTNSRLPKGTIFKTEQGSNYTKEHEIDTSIWGDYLYSGLNGYFYNYPIDDTSSLYSNGVLTSKWTDITDPGVERSLLHHITTQRSRMFSRAHDLVSAEMDMRLFDPLSVYVACSKRYTLVSATVDFLRGRANLEIEEAVYKNLTKRDFIYSYFGDGESGIKSIGGISSGTGGGGSGGGMTADQVAILSEVQVLAHDHGNKEVLDQVTQDVVDNALREMVISTDTETELTDENYLSSLRVLKEILDNNEYLRTQFLSKVNPDTAQEIIKFVKGIEIGTFTTGPLGAGASLKMENGVSRMEVDQLDVRMRATFRELIIESLKHIGGQLILSPARMKCNKVVDGGTYYRCYFDTGDGKVSNEFVAGDQARCQVFTGSGVKMYWRLVTSVGTDWINLSKTDAISGSSIPEAGDDIVQLGNRTDTTRQNAQILSTVGADAPSWKQYKGINAFSLEGKDTTVFSGTGNKIDGKTVFMSSGANVEDGINSKNSNYSSQPTSYKANDTWTLSADTTVNGIAYKSGDILTATQDSTTFVQAHWVKKVRYTDDTAVNNIQIGGVNLIINSRLPEFLPNDVGMGARSSIKTEGGDEYYTYTPDAGKQLSLYGYSRSYPAGKQYTGGIFVRHSNSTAISVNLYISIIPSPYNGFKTTLVQPNVWTYINFEVIGHPTTNYSGHIVLKGVTGLALDVKKIKLEEGNKPTAWDESPEDINLRINTAKQEALTAAGNAQTSANTANTAVGNLNTYVDGSFKDGVIEASEAKAIEKYINVVNTEKSNLEATYNTLYTNTYLEGTPKTNLLNAKVTYFGAVDTLLNSINTAISDGKTTIAEKQAVDTNYTSYKTALASLQTAIENANKAIQTKLDTLSTDKVNVIKAGTNVLPANATYTVPTTTNNYNYISIYNNLLSNKTYKLIIGSSEVLAGTFSEYTVSIYDLNTSKDFKSFIIPVSVDKQIIIFKTPDDGVGYDVLVYSGRGGQTANKSLKINNVQLGEPSIYEIDEFSRLGVEAVKLTAEQAQLAADGYMRARYIRDWAKGSTSNNNNIWGEIKVINKAGTNIAIGKIPSANGTFETANPASNATDNNTTTYATIPNVSNVANYVQIDLGAINYDIDYIQVWHYPERTFYGTKTEISVDGVNWTPVFDSAKSGTYKETAAGNIISFRPNEVLAKVLKGAAITDTFKTTINGGLISTVITEYRELNSEQVTGLISGIQGTNKNLPFLVAGGTYAEGIAGTAKAIIRHDGTVKFTEAEVEGRIIATSGEFTGKIRSNASGNRIEINPTERVFKMVANDIDVFKINFTPGSYPSAQITINSSGEAITEIWPAGLRATQLSGVKGYGHYHAGNMSLGSTETSNAANFSVDVTQGSPTPYLDIYMRGLPTSSAGIAAGTVYRDASGYLRIV